MARTEAGNAAGALCYLGAAVAGASGLVAVAAGPRLTGVVKLAAAGALAWSGLDPTRQRVKIAAGVSAALAAVDLTNGLRRGIPGRRRAVRFVAAAYNTVFAIVYNEGARDI